MVIYCTNNAASESIILSCTFLYEKLKNLFKNVSFSFSACSVFCYYLLTRSMSCSNLYTLLKPWNYSSNVETRFFYIKHSYWVSEWLQKIFVYSLSYYFFAYFRFVSSLFYFTNSPLPSLFNWPRVQLYLKVHNHIFWSGRRNQEFFRAGEVS